MRSFYFLLLFLPVYVFASATDIKLQEKYKDWFVYTALEDAEKICYIVSYPKREDIKANRSSYVSVTYVNQAEDEVSVTSNFEYDRTPVILDIDNKIKYELPIVNSNSAWTEDVKTDQSIINKMKRGLSMIVLSKEKEKTVADTYSLLGFQKAYRKMHELCSGAVV